MRTPTHRHLLSFSLMALLFLPALPAGAGDAGTTGGDFDLHLEEALALQGVSLPFSETVAKGSLDRAEGVATLHGEQTVARRENLRESSSARIDRVAAERELAQEANRGGTGRWLKKHWYVPVIVAVAAGFALADDGSDGPKDEED